MAIDRAESGLINANLGGGVIKQRIARPNEGKSGVFRTIIVFRAGDHAFFVYGFPKNQRANISSTEKMAFKELAVELFAYDKTQIEKAVEKGVIIEVVCAQPQTQLGTDEQDEQNEQNIQE